MKKFAACLLLFVTLIQVAAQNNLRLVAPDGTLFRVRTVAGYASASPQTSLLLQDLRTDTVALSIEVEGYPTLNTSVYLLDKGQPCRNKELNYRLRRNKNTLQLRYESIYNILPVPTQLVPIKPVKDTLTAWRNRFMEHLCELKDGEPIFFNNRPNRGRCEEPMPEGYLDYVPQLLKKTDTDDERLNLILNISRNNCISVHQLSVLLSHIRYELDKLKIVRDSWPNITDHNRIAELEKAFRLEAAVREFRSFLNNPDKLTPGRSDCTQPSDSARVGVFRNKLSIYETDAERMEFLLKNYRDLCYSTEQLMDLLRIFIHDRERGQAAQHLFFYCSDPQNFLTLTELFSDNISKDLLRDFVEKQRK